MKASLLLPDWRCDKCTVSMKKVRGCQSESMTATLLGSETLTRCPRSFIFDHPREFHRLTGLWTNYEKGFLPEPGGIEDQQAQIMEALMIYDRAVQEARSDYRAANKGGGGKPGAPRRGRKR